jgi:phosphatidylinositol alpha-1,6-mannosyltransferase
MPDGTRRIRVDLSGCGKTMNDSPHILVLTTDFKPMTGGVAEYLHQLWNNVARFRPVTVMSTVQCSCRIWEHIYGFEQLPPLPERQLGACFGDSLMPIRKLRTARYFTQLRRYAHLVVDRIRRQAPNCEAYVGIWDVASHFFCEELHSAGIPYSLHVHGLDVVCPLYGRLLEWRKRDFRSAKAIYANSSATAGLVREKIGDGVNVAVVYPGVDPQQNSAVTTFMVDRLKLQLGLRSGPILLTVARLVRRKGIDLVLRCIPNLLPKHPDLHYVIAGEGPEKAGLQQLADEIAIADHVHFLGQTEECTKWTLYEICDLFIMPNRSLGGTDWEGFGIVFIEAALSAKPAIGGRNGGVPEAIEDGVTGILVDPEHATSIFDALHLLLDNAELRRSMGLRARDREAKRFNWPVIAGSFSEHLPSVSDNATRSPSR